MKRKVHYCDSASKLVDGSPVCKETGNLYTTTYVDKITCKRCLRHLKRGIQTRIDFPHQVKQTELV